MNLTALCPTIDPGPQVRALLERLRPGVDEIVVAADSRAPAEDLTEYAAAADRLVRFEWRGPNRALPRLAQECSGDWILLIAGDEVPSPALVAELPRLTRARGVRQYRVPVRWLHPDAGRYLAERPWFPDYHPRLVRNDGTLYCAGARHSGVEPELPARWLEAPLYHLDLILHGEAERRAKAERNERERPGLPAPGGGALNESYYLPELQAEPALAAVPAADRDAIEAVLAAGPGRRPAPQPGEVPLIPWEEIEPYWPGRTLAPEDYRAAIVPLEDADRRLRPGEHRPLHVRVENRGGDRWPGLEREPLIRVAYRWLRPGGDVVEPEGFRTPFPAAVEPGTGCIVPAIVAAPREEGDYLLELDLVHEQVRWFGCPVRVEMRVEGAPATG